VKYIVREKKNKMCVKGQQSTFALFLVDSVVVVVGVGVGVDGGWGSGANGKSSTSSSGNSECHSVSSLFL
jgi:hypothetical protein